MTARDAAEGGTSQQMLIVREEGKALTHFVSSSLLVGEVGIHDDH